MISVTLVIGCGKTKPTEMGVPPTDKPAPPMATLEPITAATSMPPLVGSGGVIAFSSNRDGNSEIYVMNADGSDPRRLTDNSADDWSPAWSPDGMQIAFTSARDGNYEIYVMDADGSNQRRLSDSDDFDWGPDWSPDSTQIAFTSNRDGRDEIYVMNSDGTDLQRLTNDGAADQTI